MALASSNGELTSGADSALGVGSVCLETARAGRALRGSSSGGDEALDASLALTSVRGSETGLAETAGRASRGSSGIDLSSSSARAALTRTSRGSDFVGQASLALASSNREGSSGAHSTGLASCIRLVTARAVNARRGTRVGGDGTKRALLALASVRREETSRAEAALSLGGRGGGVHLSTNVASAALARTSRGSDLVDGAGLALSGTARELTSRTGSALGVEGVCLETARASRAVTSSSSGGDVAINANLALTSVGRSRSSRAETTSRTRNSGGGVDF